jgi:hypothetical protein
MVKDIFFIRSKKEDAGVEYAGISTFWVLFPRKLLQITDAENYIVTAP